MTPEEILSDILTQVDALLLYLQNTFIPNFAAGDPTSIVAAALIAIIAFVILFKLSSVIYAILKRTILLLIVGLSMYLFITKYSAQLLQQGATGQLIVFGILGAGFGLIALIIALISFGKSARHVHNARYAKDESQLWVKPLTVAASQAPEAQTQPFAQQSIEQTQSQKPAQLQTTQLSGQSIINSMKSDKSILAVLSYVIISEFGIFSSPTIHAPNTTAGILLVSIFFLAVLFLIRTVYKDYLKGISHLLASALFGLILSIVLAHFWTGTPLETLLSIAYFETEAAVALVTGVAVSIFMSGKG